VILASLLAQIEFDVLSTTEAKIFASDAEIIGMTTLRSGFVNNDIKLIQECLNDKKTNLIGDPFIA